MILDLTAEQRRRVAALYHQDFELIARRHVAPGARAAAGHFQAMAVAAE
jgi:hypothetical protein